MPLATPAGDRTRGPVLALTLAPAAAVVFGAAIVGALIPVLVHGLVGAVILASCLTVGHPVLRWLRLPETTAVEQSVMMVAAGAGLLGVLLMIVGLGGLSSPIVVLVVTAGLAGAAAVWTRPWTGAKALLRELEPTLSTPYGIALVVAAAAVAGAGLAASVVPLWDWDSLMYHLPVPHRFLADATVLGDPLYVHSGYVGAVHMLYMIAVAAGAPTAAAVLSTFFGILLAVSVHEAARRELGLKSAGLAASGVAGTTILALVMLTPRVDVTLAFFLFLAHYAVIRAMTHGSGRHLLAAALFGGIALTTKVHAGAYLLPLGVWVLWMSFRNRVPRRHFAVGVLLGLALMAPWAARGMILFGDPIFPVLAGTGVPPWLAADPRVLEAAGSVHDVLSRTRDPVSLGRVLLEPGLLSPEAESRYYVWSPLLIVGLVAVLLVPRAWPWAIPLAGYVLVLLVRSPRTNLRYLIPVVPALAVASAAAVASITRRWPAFRRWTRGALFVLSLAPLALPVALVWQWIRQPVASGRYDTLYAATVMVSERVAEDDTVLMLYEARGWPFERPVIQDNRILTWPYLAASGHARSCLRELQLPSGIGPVTHVLLYTGALRFYRSRIDSMPYVSDGALDRFVQRCLEPVDARGDHHLYRLIRENRAEPAGEA